MALGLAIFKFIPMEIWGRDILFDASAHLTITSFVLYTIWFFIDQNKNWHTPFFVFCALVLSVIAFQRIEANAHNDVGLLLGLLVSIVSIGIAERNNLKRKFRF